MQLLRLKCLCWLKLSLPFQLNSYKNIHPPCIANVRKKLRGIKVAARFLFPSNSETMLKYKLLRGSEVPLFSWSMFEGSGPVVWIHLACCSSLRFFSLFLWKQMEGSNRGLYFDVSLFFKNTRKCCFCQKLTPPWGADLSKKNLLTTSLLSLKQLDKAEFMGTY